MRSSLLLIFIVLSGCGCNDIKLNKSFDTRCGTLCYGIDAGYAGIGVCNLGSWSCNSDGELTSCDGWTRPQKKLCNGLDNDCDGYVDRFNRQCTSVCGGGYEVCIAGQWLNCTAPQPSQEVCNGKDDDCDGIIDNPERLSIEFCYDGPAGTLQFEGCNPGVKRCRDGRPSECVGQKLPSVESCDGIDNDCDGLVDEGFGKHDIVVVIDYSGSMFSTIYSVELALVDWATKYANTDYRFAAVAAPASEDFLDGKVTLLTDFTDVANFTRAIHPHGGLNTGLEPSLDAIQSCISNEPKNLGLSWRSGATRSVILFTDELPQSIVPMSDGGYVTVDQIKSSLSTSAPHLTLFTFDMGEDEFEIMALSSGGNRYPINVDQSLIKQYLEQIIKRISCGP